MLVTISPMNGIAKIVKVDLSKINIFEKARVDYLKKNKASQEQILKEYFIYALELKQYKSFNEAHALITNGLMEFGKGLALPSAHLLKCELELILRKDRAVVINCLDLFKNKFSNLGDTHPNLYLDYLSYKVMSSNQVYQQALHRKEIDYLKKRKELTNFEFYNLKVFIQNKMYKQALLVFNKVPGLTIDYEYAVLRDILTFLNTKKLRDSVCKERFMAYEKQYRRKIPNQNKLVKTCSQLSKVKTKKQLKELDPDFGEEYPVVDSLFKTL